MVDARFAGIGMTSARTRDRLVQRLREQGITNLAVLDRIRNVPRHIFVDEALGSRAYEDTALPIGFGQTISQPYIVARMTEALLEFGSVDKVLEVGTGCGYQTAVLAPLVGKLYSIERIAPLVDRAKQRGASHGAGGAAPAASRRGQAHRAGGAGRAPGAHPVHSPRAEDRSNVARSGGLRAARGRCCVKLHSLTPVSY
jgi:hypothetical protein